MDVTVEPPFSEDVIALLEFHMAEMTRASPPGTCHFLDLEKLRAADVTFWTAREGGELLACGAMQELTPDHGELKSMRAQPGHVRRGAGRAILDAIETEARRRGYRRLSLETGNSEPFAAALGLYAARGYTRCPPFGSYVETDFNVFMTKAL